MLFFFFFFLNENYSSLILLLIPVNKVSWEHLIPKFINVPITFGVGASFRNSVNVTFFYLNAFNG